MSSFVDMTDTHDSSDHPQGVVSAVTGITLQMCSLPNVLTCLGSLALTAVFFYAIAIFWIPQMTASVEDDIRVASRVTAALSLCYGGVLVLAGDRSLSRGDDGSRILGGMLYCGCTVAVPVATSCMLRMLGWRWLKDVRLLGSRGIRSMSNMPYSGPAPALIIIAMAGFWVAAMLYSRSGFPLLLVPALLCFYVAFIALMMVFWRQLQLPSNASALLQPELLASFIFGTVLLGICVTMQGTHAVRLAILVSGMNSMLFALPAVLMGIVDRHVRNTAGLSQASIYDPIALGGKFFELVLQVRGTFAFAVASSAYIMVWMFVLRSAMTLRLWTCRPFVLLSLNALCAASPYGSLGWTLCFRVPIGVCLLAMVMFMESAGNGTDPILQEVLRWLGPHPAPFLELLHGVLQTGTAVTASLCLGSGLACASYHFGASWLYFMICWSFSSLSLAARLDCNGAMVSLCLATSAVVFFLIGIRFLPEFHSARTRLIVFLLCGRLCHMGHGSLVLNSICGAALCFQFASLAFGESPRASEVRRRLFHGDPEQLRKVPFAARLLASTLLFLHGVSTHDTLLITLGCFCIYTSMASLVAGDSDLSRALVVALCGLATTFLGEVAQTYVAPLQAGIALLEQSTFGAETRSWELGFLHGFLHDVTNIMSDKAGATNLITSG